MIIESMTGADQNQTLALNHCLLVESNNKPVKETYLRCEA